MRRSLSLPLIAALLLVPAQAGAAGSRVLTAQAMPSAALGRDLTYSLYLPAAFDTSPDRFPAIYLLHGANAASADWLQDGHLQATADRLIAAGRLPPVLIAMPNGGNSWYVDSRAVGGPGDMATAIGAELPVWLEQHSRAGGLREVAGYSMGGFGALRFALLQPGSWVAAAAMSGAFWTRLTPQTPLDESRAQRIFAGSFGRPFDPARFLAASPMHLAEQTPAAMRRPAIFLICGRGDRFHLVDDQKIMAEYLRGKGFPVETQLIDGDHDWETWEAALPRVLEFFGDRLAASR